MSISVVPAAAAAARGKQIGHKKKKPIKKPEDEQVAQGQEHAADADKAQFQGERHESKDAPGLGGASFRAALASASALQGADSTGGGSSSDSSGKNNEALLIGGGVLLLGGGIALAAGGGGDSSPSPTPTPTPTNSAPVFTATSLKAAGNEDAAITGKVVATDADTADAAALTYAVKGTAPAGFTLNKDGSYTLDGTNAAYQSLADGATTKVTVTVTVSDGKVTTPVEGTLEITVTGKNDNPVLAAIGAKTLAEDTSTSFTVTATDVDTGDTLTYSAAGAKNGTVTVTEGNKVTYTPVANFAGADSFTVTVTDSKGGTSTQTVNVTVTNVAETQSIDVGTNNTPVTLSAAGDDFLYTDDSTKLTNVVINSLASGDKIQVTGASADYNFSSVGNDIHVSFTNNGIANTIVLPGLAKNGGFIYNEATAEAVAGFDFFNALTLPGGNGSGDGVAAAGGNLDDDNDANVLTRATTSAAGGNISFTESATVANNIAITDFANGDTISVSGAPTASYNFSTTGSDGKDVQIVFNNNGIVSQIILVGANTSGKIITNEVTAEQALGFDFFKAAATPTPPNTQNIDNGASVQTFDASANALNFTDDATKATNVIINGFSNNDLITVSGAALRDYNFTTTDNQDLQISFTNNGIANSIVLDNVIVNPGIIITYEQAVAAVGYNFINFV